MRRSILIPAALIPATLLLAACGTTPGQEAKNFGYAAAQPLRDLNIGNPQVPNGIAALQNPFGQSGANSCAAIYNEIQGLQADINRTSQRYVGARRPYDTRGGRVGNAWDVGVASASTFWIPFRGLVRQVSGAARRDLKAEAAADRARYRIGYLAGQARAYRCPGF